MESNINLILFSLTIDLHFQGPLYYRHAKYYVYLLVIPLLYLSHTTMQRGTRKGNVFNKWSHKIWPISICGYSLGSTEKVKCWHIDLKASRQFQSSGTIAA